MSHRSIVAIFILFGCSSPSSEPTTVSDVGATEDAVGDNVEPCHQSGTSQCNAYSTGWCDHLVDCCNRGGTCSAHCRGLDAAGHSACTRDACLEYMDARLDCLAPKYSRAWVCSEPTTKCVGDMKLLRCDDMIAGTASQPLSCILWQNQF